MPSGTHLQGSVEGNIGGHVVSVSGPSPNLIWLEEEFVGGVDELLDSAAADSASMTELLMGSWLRGMSTTTWLELLCFVSVCSWPLCCAPVCSALFCCASDCSELLCCVSACSELLCRVSVGLVDSGVASSLVVALLELGWESSEAGAGVGSELAEVLSSQAFSENAADMPRTVAMALLLARETIVLSLTFLFSIFMATPDIQVK